ncbi:MAG: hypothetical protein ACOVSW_13290 [Candidatus Kapaibacteriota bacterium]
MQIRNKKYSLDSNRHHFDSVGELTFIRGGLDETMQQEFEVLLGKVQGLFLKGENYHRIAMLLAPDIFAWRTRILRRMQDYREDVLKEAYKATEFFQNMRRHGEIATEIATFFETARAVERDIIQQVALNMQTSVQEVMQEGFKENIAENYQARIHYIREQYNAAQASFLEALLHSSLAVHIGFCLVFLVYERAMRIDEKSEALLLEFIAGQLSFVLDCEFFALNMDALASYHTLSDNWDGDGANEPTIAALSSAGEWLSQANLGAIGLRGGRINTFPTRNGGIQIDIDGLENPLEIEISPEGKMELLQYNQDLDLVRQSQLQYLSIEA